MSENENKYTHKRKLNHCVCWKKFISYHQQNFKCVRGERKMNGIVNDITHFDGVEVHRVSVSLGFDVLIN